MVVPGPIVHESPGRPGFEDPPPIVVVPPGMIEKVGGISPVAVLSRGLISVDPPPGVKVPPPEAPPLKLLLDDV